MSSGDRESAGPGADKAEKQPDAGGGGSGNPLKQAALTRKQQQRRNGGGEAQAKGDAGKGEHGGKEGEPDVKPAMKDGDKDKPPEVPKKEFLDQEAARKILEDAYGSYKTIDKGKVEILAQADFQKAYDKIYGAGPYSWDKYVKPGPGNLEGFAHDGTNYINKDCISLDTVPHEMLHNNTAVEYRDFVGNEFDEGTTEYLTIAAMNKAGKKPSHSYPQQEGCVQALIAAGFSADDLKKAYFKGGTKALLGDWVDAHCKAKWADIKAELQAKDFAKAKAHLQKK